MDLSRTWDSFGKYMDRNLTKKKFTTLLSLYKIGWKTAPTLSLLKPSISSQKSETNSCNQLLIWLQQFSNKFIKCSSHTFPTFSPLWTLNKNSWHLSRPIKLNNSLKSTTVQLWSSKSPSYTRSLTKNWLSKSMIVKIGLKICLKKIRLFSWVSSNKLTHWEIYYSANQF